MNQADSLYHAFVDYVQGVNESRECVLERNATMSANADTDLIEVVSTSCTIDEDWIAAIEIGLIHIEKAINEARQFIRTEGSVLPIEKVKRVSRDSVVHLSQHSDLITKEPQEGKDIIPDELFISERLSDFAVYENKFLYMLLNRLKSFVAIRYNKIIELTNEYSGSLSLSKIITTSKRKTVYELKMNDLRRDDFYLKERGRSEPLINRIEDIQKVILHLLSTQLMQEVSKTPPLKPPIIKTNVLKMNRNFKGATEIYDFITAYDKDGYVVNKKHEQLNPFSDLTASEIAQTVMLTSFLVYKHGLKLEGRLKNAYLVEQERRKREAQEKQKNELAHLKRRVEESGLDPFEYMLLLEKHNKSLELDSIELLSVKSELEKAYEDNQELRENIASLNDIVDALNAQIEKDNQRFEDELARLKSEHISQIEQIYESNALEMQELRMQHDEEKQQLYLKHEKDLENFKESKRAELESLKERINGYEEKIIALEADFLNKEKENARLLEDAVADCNAKIDEYSSKYNQKNEENGLLTEQKRLLEAKLLSLRREYNLITNDEDFTKKESFEELEHQYNVFKAFFKDEWRKTKKRIRKEVLKKEDKEGKTDG